MDQQEQDYFMGIENEKYITKVLCDYFDMTFLLKLNTFHPLDFYDNFSDKWFEVKSRRFNHNKYDTTMVGYNKINYIRKSNLKDVYFIFVFDDGNYYYKFNPDDKFETSVGGRCDRGKPEYKMYYYIPINMLVKIDSKFDDE